ncbi:MAG: FAD-dependent oxidoreductase [Thermoplasmatota archaeon]
MSERYEAVVVGAGTAGLAAAMELAKNGVQTLVLERGKFPGSKNSTGGILYGQTNTRYNLDYLLPDFEKSAPLERPITKYVMHAMSQDKVKDVDLTRMHFADHKWSYGVLRGRFDRWFAEQVHTEAEKSGGGVLSDVRVTGPLWDHDRIVGVETDELDPIKADVVIAADGATSELARKGGVREWYPAEKWFQGVKIVAKMDEAKINERFGLPSTNEGAAHLFAGDVFGGVRGGGFLYTNKDTLSIGTVFHLDALAEAKVEPHALLDRLLRHPLVSNWIGEDYDELEYSAKVIPDGKKALLAKPYNSRMLVVGDAAGQMMAQGPVIKGMNLGISAGVYAARSYLDAKAANDLESVGPRYARLVNASYVRKDTRPMRYRVNAALFEGQLTNRFAEWLLRTKMMRGIIRGAWGSKRVENLMSSPFWAGAMPDMRFGYATLPEILAEETGQVVERRAKFDLPTLEDRIARLKYDTAIGKPHIVLLDNSIAASGRAVHTCPVSSPTSSRGCYSLVAGKVALDTQPCVECGTCAVMAATKWEHPPGSKGVQYEYG